MTAKRLLLGTLNHAKINSIRVALASLPIHILILSDLNINTPVKEDGTSTQENAEKKARAYFAMAGIPTLAIDGGLHIEKFPPEKQPATMIRRIGGVGHDATDEQVLAYYQNELNQVGGSSVGIWSGSMTLVFSPDKIYSDTFYFTAILTSQRKGALTPGAPLDSLMLDPITGKYYSELSWQERPYTRPIFEFVKQHVEEL